MTNLQEKFQAAARHHQAGDLDAATELYRAVLKEEPHHADALHMLGVIARQKGNADLALKLTEAALAIKPDLALAWYNRSLMLRAEGKIEDALYSVQQALIHDAKLCDAWDMAGTLYRETGQLGVAATHQAQAIKLQPDNVRYRSNYAILLMSKDDLLGAYNAVRESERLDVDCISFALGNVLRASGYTEKSIPHYQRVSRLMPDTPEAQMNEAMAWLQIGEMKRAWEIWKKLPDDKESLKTIPRWQGEKIGHLLLHEEQGMGDAIQCVRYISLVRNKADKITLQLNRALQKLMQFNFPDIDVLTLEDAVPPVDARCQLMTLPALLGTTLDTIPSTIPYLQAHQDWCNPWQTRLGAVAMPRVGFVWAGNPFHRNNRNRSLLLQQLMPVMEAARGHGVSLQKWSEKDVTGLAASGLYDADPYMNDFAATAGLIKELDLVVTVDTSVAHLAGALGKPVWVLVPFDPDWRWMLAREDSPWYPTLRLFRQTAPQNWDPVLTFMAGELEKFKKSDKAVLIPKRWTGAPMRQNPFALQLDFAAPVSMPSS
jgi:tetratricopeptide (TPR) repeat protein